jgi:transmembrane sensor
MQENIKQILQQILQKGKAENASEKDKQEMLSLFHKPQDEYRLKCLLLEDLKDTSSAKISSLRLKMMFSKFWQAVEKGHSKKIRRKRYLNSFVKIAAALIIGLFVGIYITYLVTKEEPLYYTAHSPKGSVSEWQLPDGTQIFLNADSKLKYKAESKKGVREIFLEGEAWFEASTNKKRPLIVHTPYYDINVTGTQFNIKAYEDDSEIITTLEEGEIVLSPSANIILEENVTMKPGEQAILDKESKNLNIKTVNPRWYTAWKDNKLIFMNMTLEKLIILIERKYGVDIVVKDPSILNYHCDGTFKNETIIEVLEIIKKTLPINYEIVGQRIEITSN